MERAEEDLRPLEIGCGERQDGVEPERHLLGHVLGLDKVSNE